jgi:hypothetical protein
MQAENTAQNVYSLQIKTQFLDDQKSLCSLLDSKTIVDDKQLRYSLETAFETKKLTTR